MEFYNCRSGAKMLEARDKVKFKTNVYLLCHLLTVTMQTDGDLNIALSNKVPNWHENKTTLKDNVLLSECDFAF